jgi:hypothetical protein
MFISVPPYHPYSQGSLYHRSPQGKVAELRQELNSGGKKDKNHSAKKIALKKIVANMTMSNNDMVGLFPDIIACMTIPSLEIKKMCVYRLRFGERWADWRGYRCFLYLVNYARVKPEIALKALPILVDVCAGQTPGSLLRVLTFLIRIWMITTRWFALLLSGRYHIFTFGNSWRQLYSL